MTYREPMSLSPWLYPHGQRCHLLPTPPSLKQVPVAIPGCLPQLCRAAGTPSPARLSPEEPCPAAPQKNEVAVPGAGCFIYYNKAEQTGK